MDFGLFSQTVLLDGSSVLHVAQSWTVDIALLPACTAAISAIIFVLQGMLLVLNYKEKHTGRAMHQDADNEDSTQRSTLNKIWRSRVQKSGGLVMFLWKLTRMGCTVALLVTFTCSVTQLQWTAASVATICAMAYATALSLWNVAAGVQTARLVSRHLNLVTFAIFASYVYRDVWPLMTFTLRPIDEAEGSILWVQVALSCFVGVIEPLFEPRAYIPIEPEDTSAVSSPEQTASIASLLTFTFTDPIIWLGYRSTHVSVDQLFPLCDYDRVTYLIRKSYPYLDPFAGAKEENPLWSIVKAFKASFFAQTLILLTMGAAKIATPIGTKQLLSYLESHGEDAIVKPWFWIVWLGVSPMLNTLGQQLYIFISLRQFVRVEGIITSLVLDHALRIRLKAEVEAQKATQTAAMAPTSGDSSQESVAKGKGKGTSKNKNLAGRITNLVTSDLSSLQRARNFPLFLFLAPIQIILAMIFLYNILGWSSFVGMTVMVLLMPVPTWVAKQMNGVQKAKMRATDSRVQRVSEVMNALRMIKLFGWEHRVHEKISEKREEELKYIWRRKLLGLGNTTVNYVMPLVHMVATYATYTLLMKQELTASVVFSSITAFSIMRSEMFRSFTMMPSMIQGYVALGRIFDFLHNTELLDEYDHIATGFVEVNSSQGHEDVIGCGKTHFTWTNESSEGLETPSKRTFRLRVDDDLYFKKGSFNLICGPTGSGKTSLLMALLREMHYMPLGPDSWVNLPREGGVAYAAQESWIQNDTIKNNILFGVPYDEERYTKVIYQCGLKRDIDLFEAGDATEVGEKGITLSGGQKARVTLARAIYSTAEIVLLDDVLAALDVHTAKWVVNKCFKGDIVEGRTVLLITHNVALATPLADFIVTLGPDGQIASQGTVSDVLAQDRGLAEELNHAEKIDELDVDADADLDTKDDGEDKTTSKDGKLVIAEEIELGHVTRKSFMLFLSNLGGLTFWASYIAGYGVCDFFDVLQTWWLGWWARQYATRPASEVSIGYYLGVYSFFIFLVLLTNGFSYTVYSFATMRASREIHYKLVSSLLGSTFRWLDVTPISRVITRCTQDIQAVDGELANVFNGLVGIASGMAARLIAVILYTPTFLAPAIFIAVFGAWLGQMYMKSQLSIKREMSNAKAPVLSAVTGAISGLVSIRAYGAQDAFRNLTRERIDVYIRAARTFWNLNRWVAVRIDLLASLFSTGLAFYLVYGSASPDPSIVGFVLSMAVSFSDQILYFVRVYNEWEISGNSLERIQQYIDIEQEPEPKVGGTPPAYWPASGELRVEGLSARYSPDGPKVLEDVSFHVKAGERVGIVGRTGSGKSSLTLALLRCIYTEGTVYYDGVPTHAINLDALRSNVTIIPQVPELLAGTLRQNLDMFGEHDDASLNDALRAAGLFSLHERTSSGVPKASASTEAGPSYAAVVAGASAGEDSGAVNSGLESEAREEGGDGEARLTLDTLIAGGGANLSVGQRQIIALARAIVRRSKLLILDEATSAIDYDTDAVIQRTLRTELPRDATVLTVAHRLQTIMDSDKIMVLDAGRLVEFDSPRALLAKDGSFLRALVDESADREALYGMVAGEGKADGE